MARKSNDLRPGKDMSRAGKAADRSLAVAMFKVIAVGFAGGLAMIAGAKKLGDKYLDLESDEIPEIPDIEDIEGSGEDEESESEEAADENPEDAYVEEDVEDEYAGDASDEIGEEVADGLVDEPAEEASEK